MMTYYENSLKLRETSPDHPYLAHQRLDYLMQEQLHNKVPYGWKREWISSEPRATQVTLRTGFPLGLPGERKEELLLNAGDVLMFQMNFCCPVMTSITGKKNKKMSLLSDEDLPSALAKHCIKAGMQLQSHALASAYVELFRKASTRFPLKCHAISVIVEISDVALAEQAIVYGMGKKRVFGYGLPTAIEVL